jgi:5-methylcytosine-specific restriction endonuclease McrA
MHINTKRKFKVLNNAKSGVCEKCHSVFDISQLTVHHVIPKEVGKYLNSLFERNILKEHQKYGILCRKCHNEVEKLYKDYNFKQIARFLIYSPNYSKVKAYMHLLKINEEDLIDIKNVFLKTCLYYKKIYTYFLDNKRLKLFM